FSVYSSNLLFCPLIDRIKSILFFSTNKNRLWSILLILFWRILYSLVGLSSSSAFFILSCVLLTSIKQTSFFMSSLFSLLPSKIAVGYELSSKTSSPILITYFKLLSSRMYSLVLVNSYWVKIESGIINPY